MEERKGDFVVPLLAISAQDDVLVSWTASELMVAETSIVERRVVPLGGHAYNVTMPGEFNKMACDWLSS